MVATPEEWDEAWLEAEMARELAAFDLGADEKEPDDEAAAAAEADGEADEQLGALDWYLRDMAERSERNEEVERALEEDMASVAQLASRVPATPAPGYAPEPESEAQVATEPPELEPEPPTGADAHAARLRAANAEDKLQQMARLRLAFDAVEGKLVDFADDKLAVGTDLAPSPPPLPPTAEPMDLADMVAQSDLEAELWADEEEARVMDELRDERNATEEAAPEAGAAAADAAAADAAADVAADAAAGAEAERARGSEEFARQKKAAAERREREIAERKEHERARQREREEAKRARRDATERVEQKAERRRQEEAEELTRQQTAADQQASRALERERENAVLQQLLQEQMEQLEMRHKEKAEVEAERARQREAAAAEQAAAEAAAEARKLQLEEETRVAEELAIKLQQEQQEAADRELQACMDAIAKENEEMERRAVQAAEEEVAMRMAALAREEREKQRLQEAAERKQQRERERQKRAAEWARNDAVMQEYDEACQQRSNARLTAVLGKMEGNEMLAAKAAEGQDLLLQWEDANLAQLRSALTTAHGARDLNGLRSAVAAAGGCAALGTEVMQGKIVVQAWEMIGSRSVDKLHEFAADLKRKSSLGLESLEAECWSYLTAWGAEATLEVALNEAREQWNGDRLEALCAEIETHGAALAKLAEQCRAAASTAKADAANCARLEAALASEDRSMRVEALRAVATSSDTGLTSPKLQKLKAQVKSERDFMAEEESLQQQMGAARTNRDAAALKTLLMCASKLVAKSAGAGTEVAAREGGIVTEMGVAQQEMQCWSDEERILRRIEDAVATHADQGLRAALGLVEQGSSLVGHDTVESGRNALALWERQWAMCARLSSARSAENRAALEQAIGEAAAGASLSCSELQKEMALCQELLQSLDECGRAEDALHLAIQDGSLDSLRSSILLARRFASLQGLVALAAELLSAAERFGALERSVATSIEQRSLYSLRPLVEPARAEGLGIAMKAVECLRQLKREERARQQLLTAMASGDSVELSGVTRRIRADSQLSAALQSELAVVQPTDDVPAGCFAESGQQMRVGDPVPKVASDILCGRREPSLGAQLSQWQRGTTDVIAPPSAPQAVQHPEGRLEEQKLEMGLEELDAVPDFDEPAALLSINLKVNKIKQATGHLSSCVELRELLLNDNQLEALGDIPKLRKLRQLCIDMNKVISLDGIGDCTALRTLSASSNSIGSVKALSGCAEIEKLTLYRNQVLDLHGLANLRWLQHLDLGRNALKSIDGLGECPALQTLILYENQIEDLKPGALQAPMLRELWLSGNPLKSLDFAIWLPSLEHLHVSDAQINDAGPLKTCGLLQTLDLSFNSVAELDDLAALAFCPLIQVLRLNDNPVAALPGYKSALISALPALRDLDNDAANDLPSRMKQMQQAFAGAAQVDTSKLGSTWWLNDQTGDVDWQRVLRSQSADEPPAGANREDVWTTRTFRHSCLCQREERAQLTRQHKRNMRTLDAQRSPLAAGTDSVYSMALAADEDGAAKARGLLAKQHNQQQHFSAKGCQNVIVRNDGYTSRTKEGRERTACATVQSRWRGWFIRHQTRQRRIHAALSIQMRWAAYWAKVQHANGGKEAVRIQAMFRGHHVRRRLKHALDSAKYMDDDDNDFLAVDEDEFSLPSGLDSVWIPDMRKSLEMDLDSPEKPQAAAEPRRERVAARSSAQRSHAAAAAPPAAETASTWDEAPQSRGYDRGSHIPLVFPSAQTPPRRPEHEQEQELSPTSTARSARHDGRVAGMFERTAQRESTVVNEWGLTDLNAIQALKKKARRTRRHDNKAKKKTMSAAQKLDHYQRTQGSSGGGWSDAGSARSTPSPSPTPPMSARSDSRMNSSLVRRIGSSAPPSPATSSLLETGGLQQFNSGQPNQRASRDLASRGSDGSRGNGSRQTTPVTRTNNFLAAPAAAPAPVSNAPWGMAAQAGAGGRIAAPVVQRGGNAARKKVKKHVPRVAGLTAR